MALSDMLAKAQIPWALGSDREPCPERGPLVGARVEHSGKAVVVPVIRAPTRSLIARHARVRAVGEIARSDDQTGPSAGSIRALIGSYCPGGGSHESASPAEGDVLVDEPEREQRDVTG
jgi:hypothetical protein